ncbi:MAG: hypothetical protein AVDCRST_MAG87-1141, partial [uncultured Thermomicrobiales bacterium]
RTVRRISKAWLCGRGDCHSRRDAGPFPRYVRRIPWGHAVRDPLGARSRSRTGRI